MCTRQLHGICITLNCKYYDNGICITLNCKYYDNGICITLNCKYYDNDRVTSKFHQTDATV